MLKTIENYIHQTNKDFNEFYQSYIMYLQDIALQNEINSMKSKYTLNIYGLDHLISDSAKELNNIVKCKTNTHSL